LGGERYGWGWGQEGGVVERMWGSKLWAWAVNGWIAERKGPAELSTKAT
jgi:hypothetical protein